MDKIKIIILDFDGTLGDTASVIIDTMQATIRELRLPSRTDAECASMIGLRLVEIPAVLFPECNLDAELYASTYRRLFHLYNTDGAVLLYPGVKETLTELKRRGYILTIASSRSHASLAEYVENLGISPYISFILGADDVKNGKPDPEPVEKTLEKFKMKPEEAIVIGDTAFDIHMGRNAGARTCGVTYGNGSRESLEDADFIIDDFRSLPDIIPDTMIPEWAKEMNCAVTVCDKEGVILYMNDKAKETFASHGDLIGKSLIPCHSERSRGIISELLATGGSNAYTIQKNGVKKMIYQTAWKENGKVAGLVEISMIIPEEMPHYVR